MSKRGDKRRHKLRRHQRAQAQNIHSQHASETDLLPQASAESQYRHLGSDGEVVSVTRPISILRKLLTVIKEQLRRGNIKASISKLFAFFIGVVATLVFQPIVVAMLPKPEFWVEFQPWPSAVGQCQLFYVIINARDPIERFNVKLPMPVVIDAYLVGVSEETVIDDKYQHIVKVDEDGTGRCTLEDVSKNNYLDLTAAAAGTTLSLQGANIPRATLAYAWVTGRAGTKPVGPMMTRSNDPGSATGQFSYLKLGQLVTKEVPIAYGKPDDPLWWKKE